MRIISGILFEIIFYSILVCTSFSVTTANAELYGEYWMGDGISQTWLLRVKKDNSYDLFFWSDLIEFCYRGEYCSIGDRMVLTNPIERKRTPLGSHISDRHPKMFIIVKWESRTYLVSEMDMIDFCNAINLGLEPRTLKLGHVYLKAGNEKININQKPKLPYPWNECIVEVVSTKVTQKINNKFGIFDTGKTV